MITDVQRIQMLQCPVSPVDMVLDTDAYNEIDDQFAISYALRATEKISLKALYAAPFFNSRSTSPEEGMEKSYDEILTLLDLAGEKVPVFKGSPAFMKNEKEAVMSPAASDLAERAMGYACDKPLYVVAIGAITNVASALLLRPEIADRIVVVWLGGHSLEWHDNKEFNLQQDVAAGRVVFGSGAPLVMLPCMGVVSAFTTTEPELRYWMGGKNALADYLLESTVREANTYAAGKVWSRPIWDVTAVAWLLNDGGRLLLEKLIPTPIPEYDHYYAADSRRPLCKYVYHIDRDALFSDLVEKVTR